MRVIIGLAFGLLLAGPAIAKGKSKMTAPTAKEVPHVLESQGNKRNDPYYWLKERESPEVKKYLEQENAYVEGSLAHLKPLRKTLFEEIKGRIKEEDISVPYKDGPYYYYTRFEKGSEYPIYCRKKGSVQGAEEVLINVNELAKGSEFFDVAGMSPSVDHTLIAFGVDNVGRRNYTLQFKDTKTGKVLDDKITNTTGGAAWAADNKTIFFTRKDEKTLRPYQIFKYVLGSHKEPELIFEEKDETYRAFVYTSKDNEYVFIKSAATLSDEVRFISASKPNDAFKIFKPREKDFEYSVEHLGNEFYVLTNWQAKNFRILKTPIDKTDKDHWKEFIAHRPDTLIEDFEVFKKHIVVEERSGGLDRLQIVDLGDSKKTHYIEFDDEAYSATTNINAEIDTDQLRFSYTSLTTPDSVYEYDMNTHKRTLLKQREVVGGYDPALYQSKRIWATAHDGTKVPVSLVFKKSQHAAGKPSPLLLYGYGSYGASMTPYFSSARISLLDRGWVFAIAHIRGGQEMGRGWYDDGKLLKKKNTFTDFVECAEALIKDGYTSKDKLAAMGGSAGGLLMGAVINMRPDLFHAIVAQVPFVDVVTTMLDDSIPLTTNEYDEWGNPNDKAFYDYMLSYSPYDNVHAASYPAMLVTTGLHDSQVQYWEPAKWVARLRKLNTGKLPIYFKTEMEAGHGGKSGRFKALDEVALEYAFLIDTVK